MEQDGKLGLCEITEKTDEKDIIRKVNLMTEGHIAWRLLFFEGTDRMQRPCPPTSGKCMRLLEYYAGNGRTGIQVKCRCYPEEVWYLGWQEKQDIIGSGSRALKVPAAGLAGNIYSFCMIASMDSEIAQRYSEFMACCNLLILAINQFPAGFLSPFRLYYVEAEVDRKKFAEYVNRQYGDIVEIEKLFTLESQRLQEQRQKGVPCPGCPKVVIEELGQDEPPQVGELKRRITWEKSEGNIEYALSQNAYEIRKWMHYPRGVMSGVVDRLEEELDKEQMAGGFLSIAGRDLLERQLENAMEKLSIERKEAMGQADFEYELRKRENAIRKRTRKKLVLKQKLVMVMVAAIAEVPFLCFTLNMLRPFIGDGNMGEGVMICRILVAVAVALLAMFLVPVASFYYERHCYGKILKEQMQDKAERKREYLKRILGLVAEYQYYVRLDREQRGLGREWEIRNKNLGHHLWIWQQSKATKLQLRYLLDKDEQENVPHVKVDVDFEEEPQEIPYYWTAYKGSCFKAELNDSGYMMEAALEFITRYRCVDNPAKVAVLQL